MGKVEVMANCRKKPRSFLCHTFLEFEISLKTDLSSLCSGLLYALDTDRHYLSLVSSEKPQINAAIS